MNFNLCPTCSAPVGVEDDCDRPECIIAARDAHERNQAVKRGCLAYNCYADFLPKPVKWDDLHSSTRERWISAVQAAREEAQS